jgi:hypothetical protein
LKVVAWYFPAPDMREHGHPDWVPVQQVEMKTERFAMAYRLVSRLRLCPSGV